METNAYDTRVSVLCSWDMQYYIRYIDKNVEQINVDTQKLHSRCSSSPSSQSVPQNLKD